MYYLERYCMYYIMSMESNVYFISNFFWISLLKLNTEMYKCNHLTPDYINYTIINTLYSIYHQYFNN